jgi:hypothetical protein
VNTNPAHLPELVDVDSFNFGDFHASLLRAPLA